MQLNCTSENKTVPNCSVLHNP
uniref:Uncharacterized protein n=1 Tax=Arundo donax TaxID=35708 RepID=A0A0A8ZG09_ARUDO